MLWTRLLCNLWPWRCTVYDSACRYCRKGALGASDVTSTYGTEALCLSKMIWVPPVSIMKTYYEMSKYDNGQFTENQKRQCAAGEETQAKINSKDCPFHDAFCNRYPRIDEIDLDNDNYNQFLLHSSFTKLGKIKQCDYLGAKDPLTDLYDAQKYPLAPCPDDTVPYYCDFPQNSMFGMMINQINGTNGTKMNTTCGEGLYNNQTRQLLVYHTVYVNITMVLIAKHGSGPLKWKIQSLQAKQLMRF